MENGCLHGRILPPTTQNKSRVVPPISQITQKNKKFKKLKFTDKAKQVVYIGVHVTSQAGTAKKFLVV